ncbi:MAG TPA: PAS domain-containing protein [Chitinophaga sp.]|uniref:PAS domain-containing protein n=1 Tax=Chitinophaga sp. TaxID=1869181 RepID=UPI002BCC0F33|nr:PAS domain-containing protein [Chitinophaga sp.]HVI46245.1 PAS domain-containing protein [Chitinophaga sp.]
MRTTPLKLGCLFLLSIIIGINANLITAEDNAVQIKWLIAAEALSAIAFIIILISLIRKTYHTIQYQQLFNDHPIPMWIYEKPTLKFMAVNKAAVEKYGYTESEFRNLTLTDIREKEEVDALMENIRERCNGVEYRGIWKHRKKNGTNFFVEIYAHSTTYYGKDARFIMAIDVDAQVRKAREAHQLGVRYELLAQATNDAVYDRNLLNNTVSWSHGLEKLFMHIPPDSGDIIGWWKSNLHPADRGKVLASLEQSMLTFNSNWSEQYRFACGDGSYKYVIDRAFIIYENGVPTRMIGMIQDIDMHVKQAIQLEERNEVLREIAWINSHEIRRPVVSILSITNLFDKSNKDIHLNSRLMDWLHQSTQQLDDIIHKIETKAKHML